MWLYIKKCQTGKKLWSYSVNETGTLDTSSKINERLMQLVMAALHV